MLIKYSESVAKDEAPAPIELTTDNIVSIFSLHGLDIMVADSIYRLSQTLFYRSLAFLSPGVPAPYSAILRAVHDCFDGVVSPPAK